MLPAPSFARSRPLPETRLDVPEPAAWSQWSGHAFDLLILADRTRLHESMARGLGHLIANVVHLLTLFDPPLLENDQAMGPTPVEQRWTSERCHATHRVLARQGHLAEPEETPVVVQELLHEIEEWASLQGGVDPAPCEIACPAQLSAAAMPATELLHAVMSIILNAKEAVQSELEGRVTLVASEDEDGIHLDIADNGPGFDPAIVDRACEPFVTTKDHRLGLGLAAARCLLERRGGSLELVTTSPGARVRLTVPVWKRRWTSPVTPGLP